MDQILLPLEIKNITKSFNEHKVLKDVSLSVNQGEIFGLIGLNGVGKTTLIKIILDLLKQDDGSCNFFGIDNTSTNSRENISYLPEKFYPSQFLTGKEFLSLTLSYHKKDYDDVAVNMLAEKLGLDFKVLDNKIGKYSKGMGQKLGLLSVFLCQSPLMILDEPMSGLDPSARIQLKNMLLNYITSSNKTVFFSSHILSDIDEICNRIAVIDDGNLIFLGTPARFKKYYNESSLEQAFIKAIKKDESIFP
ncbi:putative ABC transporter ATP-binding protein YxlF [Candidatus Arcanobacter lacustris]|uniref:Putative ABC transporter ATP-binding protein YxlF n=1 Tax=Candidatus Arcanibacter lacustris TaxID=1607817 RepID=A0A0F5MQ39_9RICK|nr:putative ABC transporter ATP-binding protein YxlF [Candidatus Arcanobacter lacustris]